jgi:hypothetical protein
LTSFKNELECKCQRTPNKQTQNSNTTMKTITATPKPMQNSIWSRPEIKHTKKRWEYSRKHERNKLTNIGLVSQKGGKFFIQNIEFPTFEDVKVAATKAGFDSIRMGAVKVSLK